MSAIAWRRTKEEVLLLLVSLGAAGVVVSSLVRDAPSAPEEWAPVWVAASLSLVALFAFWFAGAARRSLEDALRREQDLTKRVLAAVPEGMLVIGDGRVLAVNRRLCQLLGYERDELVGATAPFSFWPPEHRHEIEHWHSVLSAGRDHAAELVFAHRNGARIPVLVAGGRLAAAHGAPYVLTVRDVSASHRRARRLEELASRDPETALLNERGFEESLRESVRQALAAGGNVSVAVLVLGDGTGDRGSIVSTPQGLLAAERLRAIVRAGEAVARIRGDELAWVLPGTAAEGAVEAVARARDEIADAAGLQVTAGICELAVAGDALSLYALAERALVAAKRQGAGTTACYPDAWPVEIDDLARTLVG